MLYTEYMACTVLLCMLELKKLFVEIRQVPAANRKLRSCCACIYYTFLKQILKLTNSSKAMRRFGPYFSALFGQKKYNTIGYPVE